MVIERFWSIRTKWWCQQSRGMPKFDVSLVCSIWPCARRPNSSYESKALTAQGTWLCNYTVLSVFKKVFGAYFLQTQTKLAVVVTEKPLLGSVNKVLPLPLFHHLHRVEDDITNRVTFDYCEIVHKIISSSNCVKKDNTGQVTCLKLERSGGGGGGAG